MRWVSELHNRHEGQTAWIAGSDPSLDGYPNDFLRSKLSFTLHLAFLKFPYATYRHANEYDRVAWFKKHRPEYMKKPNTYAFPFYKRTRKETLQLTDTGRDDYWFFKSKPYPPEDVNVIEKMVREVRAGERIEFGGHGTCLHACWYVALMTGVSTINIIGCNHEPRGRLEHFAAGNKQNYYRAHSTPYRRKGRIMKRGTKLLLKACRRQGVEVNWIRSYEQAVHLGSEPQKV